MNKKQPSTKSSSNYSRRDFLMKTAEIGDLNTNIFSGPQSYDVAEIGLHPFMLAYANDNFRDYTLLPIFPFRMLDIRVYL